MSGYKYRIPYTVRLETDNPDVVKCESGIITKDEPMTDQDFLSLDFGAKVVSFTYANELVGEGE